MRVAQGRIDPKPADTVFYFGPTNLQQQRQQQYICCHRREFQQFRIQNLQRIHRKKKKKSQKMLQNKAII